MTATKRASGGPIPATDGRCPQVRHQLFDAEPLESRLCFTALFTLGPAAPTDLGYFVGTVPYQVTLGDFNGDGLSDLAVVPRNFTNTNVTVLLSNGDGNFRMLAGPPIDESIVAGDFTGNGRTDLALSENFGNQEFGDVISYLGNGDGAFSQAPGGPVSSQGINPVILGTGDFTGSGRTDLVVVNNLGGGGTTILLANKDGTFTATRASPLSTGGPIAVGDFNGDGKLDIAVASEINTRHGSEDSVQILLGNGRGGFTPGRRNVFPGQGIDQIVAGDFNGDGRLDLAALDIQNDQVLLLLNKGGGRFVEAPEAPLSAGVNPLLLETGDLTGNGRNDLAICDMPTSDSEDVDVLLGNGDGTFAPAPGSPFNGSLVRIGDFTTNHEPDLSVTSGAESLAVLENTSPDVLPAGTVGAIFSGKARSIRPGTTGGTARITVTAPTGTAVKGRLSIALYASTDMTLFNATQVTRKFTERVNLKPGRSKAFKIPVALLASSPPGSYNLIALVAAPDGTLTGAAGPTVTIT